MAGCRLDSSGVLTACGPLALEEALLAAIRADVVATRADPARLARPLRVVVPSRSLHLHVSSVLATAEGRAVAGVQVQTLHGLALEVHDRAGVAPTWGEALLPVLVRRAARLQPALGAALAELVDGFAVVEGAVRDLFDAGFDRDLREPMEERLDALVQEGHDVALARALVATADDALALMSLHRVGHGSRLLRRASELLEEGASLPARGIAIHGFSDGTGVVTELLRSLQRCCGAVVFLDRPPRPGDLEAVETGGRFGRRFREVLTGGPEVEHHDGSDFAGTVATPTCAVALGAQAEVRHAAFQIRELLDAGARPESMAIVLRDIEAYAPALRVQLGRLGVPFSGVGAAGPGGPEARRLEALLELQRTRGECPTDRWLDCLQHLDSGSRADLRSALRHRGAARLFDVSNLEVKPLVLPFRAGLLQEPADDEPQPPTELEPGRSLQPRRRVAIGVVRDVVAAARSLRARWERAPDSQTCAEQCAELELQLRQDLKWLPGRPGWPEVLETLAELRDEGPQPAVSVPTSPEDDPSRGGTSSDQIAFGFDPPAATEMAGPPAWHLDADEFALVVRRAVARRSSEPIGGAGGGVQVLSVMEARGRTFEQLFVLGLNRDVFPRSIREDPLLPDVVRRPLADMLPDLVEKSVGYDEERFLFAQLLAASPLVRLSWLAQDDDGKRLAPSTLVERLRWAVPDLAVAHASPLHARPDEKTGRDASALEHAMAAGLHGDATGFAQAFGLAVVERAEELGGEGFRLAPQLLTASRLAVAREIDRGVAGPAQLGPYFGFLGRPRDGDVADPRRRPLYVTTVEATALCPWKAFLERLLRIEPNSDPLESLPNVDARERGAATHDTLQKLAMDGEQNGATAPESLDDALSRAPRLVSWPGDAAVRDLLRETCRELLGDLEGALPGLLAILQEQVWRHLEVARELEWPSPEHHVAVLGTEVEGSCEVSAADGSPRTLHFRADRVDATATGPMLIDYKTGRPPSRAKGDATRRRNLVRGILEGRQLQAIAYARSRDDARGRYLYLSPGDELDLLRVDVDSADLEQAEAFDQCVAAVLSALDSGAMPPRLLSADRQGEPQSCSWCQVREACLQGDSAARGRMRQWLASSVAMPPRRAEEISALRVLALRDGNGGRR